MPFFIVTGGPGLAIVEADDELDARLDVMSAAHVSDPGLLNAELVEFSPGSNRVMILRSFVDDTPLTHPGSFT